MTYPGRAARHLLLLVVPLLTLETGCASKGLVRDAYPPDFYKIPRLLPDNTLDENPRFIIYGDSRPDWRGGAVLAKKRTWLTWWQLAVPFYQLYLVGSGFTTGINYLRRTPDWGERQARRVRDDIYAQAKRSNVDFIIHAGDIATDGRLPKHWATFLRQNTREVPLALEYPFLPTIGNHEMANDSVYGMPNYRDVFSYPQFYVFTCPDVDFFMLDSSILIDQDQLIDDDTQDELFARWIYAGDGAAQPAWLERQLETSTKAFKVVVMHHPPLVFGRHFDNWLNPKFGRDLQQKRQLLLRLFQRHGVQIVFSGHQHLYEHSVLTYRNDSDDEDKLHEVITGGGGSPLHAPHAAGRIEECSAAYRDEGFDVLCVAQESIYNYCLVDVTADNITVQVFEVTESLETTGRVVDTIIVRR